MPDRFSITATWDLAAKAGRLANGDGSFLAAHVGSSLPEGRPGPNPEELLLAGVATCFVQTWGIFLEKLKVPLPAPRLDAACEMDKDPAGGFRVTRIDLVANVPAALLATRRADVDRTLSLAEKYCIVSKAVKGSIPVSVTSKPV